MKVFFAVSNIRDVKHTLEFYWNTYQVSPTPLSLVMSLVMSLKSACLLCRLTAMPCPALSSSFSFISSLPAPSDFLLSIFRTLQLCMSVLCCALLCVVVCQGANGGSVKLGSTHGRPLVTIATLSGDKPPPEAPRGQCEVVDLDGTLVRPGARMAPRRLLIIIPHVTMSPYPSCHPSCHPAPLCCLSVCHPLHRHHCRTYPSSPVQPSLASLIFHLLKSHHIYSFSRRIIITLSPTPFYLLHPIPSLITTRSSAILATASAVMGGSGGHGGGKETKCVPPEIREIKAHWHKVSIVIVVSQHNHHYSLL